jgi:anaerobic ribonucleoside-triphosphate reductase
MEENKRTKCEVWSRVVGYMRPTAQWNEGKKSEFLDRKMFGSQKEDSYIKDEE